MRALRYHEYGEGLDALVLDELERPDPGPGEVLIDVGAASINWADVKQLEGLFGPPPELPMTFGSDVAGTVADVGAGVSEFAVGDRVFGTGMKGAPGGTVAEYAVAPVDNLAPLPDGVAYATGAAGALVGATAWRAMVHHGETAPGDACLVHGAAGGVGHVAVQLAALAGGFVIGTAGSRSDRDRLGELGVDVALDYHRDDLQSAIRETVPDGVDVTLDAHVEQYLALDVALAAQNGIVVHIAGDAPAIDNASATRVKELTLQGMMPSNAPAVRPVLERVARLYGSGRLTVVVDREYALEDAPEAVRAMTEESVFGKLAIVP